MIIQVQDVLRDAMGLCGATEIDEAPSASEMALALRSANVMLDRWSAQRLTLRSGTSVTFTAIPTKFSYTVGVIGTTDIVAAKPLSVKSAFYRDSNILHPVEVISTDVYDSLPDREVSSGPPQYLAYDPGAAQQAAHMGTIQIYPTPDRPYVVTFDADMYLTEFVNFTDVVSFEPAYYEAIIYGLAVRLWPRYHDDKSPVRPDIVEIANNSFNAIRSLNSVTPIAAIDIGGRSAKYNVYTDT